MRFDAKEAWAEWNSLDFFPKSQFEAWSSALNDSHLKWSLDKSPSTSFSGKIKMRHLGGVRLLYCVCDTCNGKRTPSEINKSEGEYFGLLYIYEGSEIVFHEDKPLKLEKTVLPFGILQSSSNLSSYQKQKRQVHIHTENVLPFYFYVSAKNHWFTTFTEFPFINFSRLSTVVSINLFLDSFGAHAM
ncbi:hypothetical protein SAMN02745975_01690 [Geosporobacter subterraneus DSM 17957]|uniref:Uncharacterized protein n=1 Tax=Geosporobacter subterraneus DSM 17957 TaxID=1121919 RepID=A0A1M6I039_9FIRM|nr:hypothetical protein SAMN02745975_01690 [Geosporobacter subterraneus DSM 17957]